MLQALNTGHDGSLTTVHANSPADALRRVETLALMAGVGLPHAAVRDQVASALDVVVHQARLPDGARVVESVSEVLRVAGGAGTRELWTPRQPALRQPGPGELASRLDGAARRRRPRGSGRGDRVSAVASRGFVAGAAGGSRCASSRVGRARGARGARRRAGCARSPALVDALVAGRARGPRSGRGRAPQVARRWRGVAFVAGLRHRSARSPGIGARRGGPARRSRGCSRARRRRYRAAVEAGLPEMAVAIADALAGGRSLRTRARRGGGGRGRRGRARAAPHRRRAGRRRRAPTTRSRRCGGARRSPGMDALVAACLLQRRAGGDLARLLRESARALEDQARLEDEVRAATAQARFTALLVVLLPLGGGLLAELASPGWFAGLWSSFLTAWLVGIALVLQALAAVLMQRLGRVRMVTGAPLAFVSAASALRASHAADVCWRAPQPPWQRPGAAAVPEAARESRPLATRCLIARLRPAGCSARAGAPGRSPRPHRGRRAARRPRRARG